METKHTKGDWEVENKSSEHGNYFVVKSNTVIICDITANICNITTRNYEQSEYNAKLIAAAPELLEALMNCQLGIEKMIGWEQVDEQAKAAIKKAT
jgi:hypothetical protein